jgi:hypothetical protein
MRTWNIIFSFLIFCSCRQPDKGNSDILLDENSDTIEIVKRYPSRKIREIIKYDGNKPHENFAISEQGDTIKFPRVFFIDNADSLFVFIPIGKNFGPAELLFDVDSADIAWGRKPKYVCSIEKSGMLKKSVEMLSSDNKFRGAFKFVNESGSFEFWPFLTGPK